MATKKKSFDAVAESRRWRTAAGQRRAAMTPGECREHLRRTTEAFFAAKPKHAARELAHR